VTDLSSRLHDLADMIERGVLPEADVEALDRLTARVEQHQWIRTAAARCGGVGGLLRLLRDQAWRVRVWLSRPTPPTHGDTTLIAVYNALELGPLPTPRHLRRICGHSMSASSCDAGISHQEMSP
jgi:hypothetical protein